MFGRWNVENVWLFTCVTLSVRTTKVHTQYVSNVTKICSWLKQKIIERETDWMYCFYIIKFRFYCCKKNLVEKINFTRTKCRESRDNWCLRFFLLSTFSAFKGRKSMTHAFVSVGSNVGSVEVCERVFYVLCAFKGVKVRGSS